MEGLELIASSMNSAAMLGRRETVASPVIRTGIPQEIAWADSLASKNVLQSQYPDYLEIHSKIQ